MIRESDPDPYDLLDDQEMPQIIPGMMTSLEKSKMKDKQKAKGGKGGKGKNDDDVEGP